MGSRGRTALALLGSTTAHLQWSGWGARLFGSLMHATRVIQCTGAEGALLDAALLPAVEELRGGSPVAIPTETVYGLAANALDAEACRSIFSVKGRPSDNPLIVHISSLEMLSMIIPEGPARGSEEDILDRLDVPARLKAVLRRFWPGPLTVLLPRRPGVVLDVVTAGLETVAVRFPSHPIARRIIDLCGFPLAAPSANLSGRPSPTSAQHVLDDLEGRIATIVDGGPSNFGLESTVLDAVSGDVPLILRPGSVTIEMLRGLLPEVEVFSAASAGAERASAMAERPSTPGMKYRHYSPVHPVVLFKCPCEALCADAACEAAIERFIDEQLGAGRRVVRILLAEGRTHHHGDPRVTTLSQSRDGSIGAIGRSLFASLRAADATSPDVIVVQGVPAAGPGRAIMNRLEKAATRIVELPMV